MHPSGQFFFPSVSEWLARIIFHFGGFSCSFYAASCAFSLAYFVVISLPISDFLWYLKGFNIGQETAKDPVIHLLYGEYLASPVPPTLTM